MSHIPVVIVGAGFGGIGLGVRLRQAGIDDFIIVERTADLGGTWSQNTYPGAACDVPSTLYSFSFAPKRDWTHYFSKQPDILAYLEDCVARFGVGDRIRLSTTVRSAQYSARRGCAPLTKPTCPPVGVTRSSTFFGARRATSSSTARGRNGSSAALTHNVGVVMRGRKWIELERA